MQVLHLCKLHYSIPLLDHSRFKDPQIETCRARIYSLGNDEQIDELKNRDGQHNQTDRGAKESRHEVRVSLQLVQKHNKRAIKDLEDGAALYRSLKQVFDGVSRQEVDGIADKD